MKIIVTGGAGFLGSHLCDKLLELENEVICIDNLSTSDGSNIEHLRAHPNFKFIKLDITEKLVGDLEADEIYHLASPASPNKNNKTSYMALPFETMLANTTGTWNLAEFAQKKGVKMLFASSSEVYGDPEEHPQKESYRGNVSTTGPRSVYDEAKRFGETIMSAFIREKGMEGRIVRIFNTYGPRMFDDGRVITNFIKQALKNDPLTVYGDGKQTRSFCYVSDLIDGLIVAMDKGEFSEVYNLGNPGEYTVLQVAEKVIQLTDTRSEIVFAEKLPTDDPLKRCPDISKAKGTLGWEPKIKLEEGLDKFINWMKSKKNG